MSDLAPDGQYFMVIKAVAVEIVDEILQIQKIGKLQV